MRGNLHLQYAQSIYAVHLLHISHSQVLGKSCHMLFDRTVNKTEECVTNGCFLFFLTTIKAHFF